MTTTSSAADSGSGRACTCRGMLGRRFLHQHIHRIRQARAVLRPVRDAVHLQAQALFAFTGDGIVEAHALDEATVATVARIGDDHVVERAVPGTPAGKPNDYHVRDPEYRKKDTDYTKKIGSLARRMLKRLTQAGQHA